METHTPPLIGVCNDGPVLAHHHVHVMHAWCQSSLPHIVDSCLPLKLQRHLFSTRRMSYRTLAMLSFPWCSSAQPVVATVGGCQLYILSLCVCWPFFRCLGRVINAVRLQAIWGSMQLILCTTTWWILTDRAQILHVWNFTHKESKSRSLATYCLVWKIPLP